MYPFSIASDGAVTSKEDLLSFSRYTTPLIYVLTNPETKTPFTIGIFGPWGSGKSSLLSMLDEELAVAHPDEFVRVHFNPWIHRSEPNMLVPLLHTLHDTLAEDRKNRFLESARTIGNVLVRLGADTLLKKLTANAASLEGLEKLEQNYFRERGRVESEMRKLKKTLQQEADLIADKGARIIFFVDDMDRCDPHQMIDLLESVKLFLDLRNVFVILAVDKEVIDRGIEVKYSKFQFGQDRQAALGGEYLEKMVQLPLVLFPLHKTQVRDFVEKLNPIERIRHQISLLIDLLHPNPRKIKRILNILTVVDSITNDSHVLKSLKHDVIAQLVILQVQSPDLYAAVVREPKLLIALEKVFDKAIRLEELEDFSEFGSNRKGIQELCVRFYSPGSYLKSIFCGTKLFSSVEDQLEVYLSMV